MARILSLLLLALLPASLNSFAVDYPTNEQIAQAARESEQVLKRLESGYKGLDKVSPVDGAKAPEIPVAPEAAKGFSLEALAKQYSSVGKAQKAKHGADLMVFVTLAMPAESLRRLSSQAERAGAVLVLRGLKNNSMTQTTAAVRAIAGKAAWQINPPAFTRFNVQTTPTFVVARAIQQVPGSPPQEGCAPPQSFVSITGDVSIDYALEAIEKDSPEFRAEAAIFLAKMRGRQ